MPASAALQHLPTSELNAVFCTIDAMTLRSSLTLFVSIRPEPLFAAALDRWFGGERDTSTLEIVGAS